jgi:hypothetical protein
MDMGKVEQVKFLLREAEERKKKLVLTVDEFHEGNKTFLYSSSHYIYGLIIQARFRAFIRNKQKSQPQSVRHLFETERNDRKKNQFESYDDTDSDKQKPVLLSTNMREEENDKVSEL